MESDSRAPSTAKTGSSETILVVDDEPAVLEVAKQSLRTLGYEVLSAAHGIEALDIAGEYEGEIHMLLTDLTLPLISGEQVARQLREQRPGIKVLLMTGYGKQAEALEDTIDNVEILAKPFTLRVLAARIREILDAEEG